MPKGAGHRTAAAPHFIAPCNHRNGADFNTVISARFINILRALPRSTTLRRDGDLPLSYGFAWAPPYRSRDHRIDVWKFVSSSPGDQYRHDAIIVKWRCQRTL